jgi:hypothetical protein
MKWRIRKASIPEREREMFERFGPAVVAAVLYDGGSGRRTLTEPQQTVLHGDLLSREHAAEWLTEQYHRAERRETWSITMEAAITVLVAAELVFSTLNFFHKG